MPGDDVRDRLRRKLEETFGMDEASYLMDRPPGGWADLATHQDLRDLERRLDEKLHLELALLRTEISSMRTEILAQLRGEVGSVGTELHGEVGSLRTELHDEVGSLRTELHDEVGSLRTELHGEVGSLRTELHGRMSELELSMERGFRTQTWRLMTMMAAGFGSVLATVVAMVKV